MSRRGVVVTGVGLVSPHGNDAGEVFARLMDGQSAIRDVTLDESTGYSNIAAPAELDPPRDTDPRYKPDQVDRVSLFAIAAANAAIADSGIVFTAELRHRAGVSVGTGMGSAGALEETFRQALLADPTRIRPLTVLKVMNNASAGRIAIQHQLGGPDLTYSCACASSAVAIGEAGRQIRHGYSDVMIAGGSEAILTSTFFRAWDAMHVLAPRHAAGAAASWRPFAKDRRGLVLGEGAAMVVLEERESALRRGAAIYGELAGYGSSNEYAHLTKPSVEGQARAISLALADGGLAPDEVDYVNAHGTATLLNDPIETRALKQVFGPRAARIPISSTKSMHGHLLGAAGALEFVISLLALRSGAVPPTANLEHADPECDLDYVPGRGRRGEDVRCVLSNSFAFGGTNAVLVAHRI
jgi:3-oxoacyl-[acyl-carrier-protein] synthase II